MSPFNLWLIASRSTNSAIFLRKLTIWRVLASSILAHTSYLGTYRLSVPPAASDLEEGEMATEGCCKADSIRVRLELFIRNCLLNGNLAAISIHLLQASTHHRTHGIVRGLDRQVRDPNRQY